MGDDKVIVEGVKSYSSLCPLSVWLRVMANRGVSRGRHFLLGRGELIPKRTLLKICRGSMGKGPEGLLGAGQAGCDSSQGRAVNTQRSASDFLDVAVSPMWARLEYWAFRSVFDTCGKLDAGTEQNRPMSILFPSQGIFSPGTPSPAHLL